MIITRTPFRISFFGGGTDYPTWFNQHGGAVLGTSINKYCYLFARYTPSAVFDHKTRISYSQVEHVNSNLDIKHAAVRECLRFMAIEDGVEIFHDRDLPSKRGMGASSTFVVGLLHALYGLKGVPVDAETLAQSAVYVEQQMIKENVGNQDQYLAAYGGFNHIEFTQESTIVHRNVISLATLNQLEKYVMLFSTKTSRIASKVAGELIKNMPNREAELKRMCALVNIALSLLRHGKVMEFGRLLNENWIMKRTLASGVTTPEIDSIYEMALKAGALGGKLVGAGGGGFMVLLVEPDKQSVVKKALEGLIYVPIRFEYTGSQIIYRGEGNYNWSQQQIV